MTAKSQYNMRERFGTFYHHISWDGVLNLTFCSLYLKRSGAEFLAPNPKILSTFFPTNLSAKSI